MLMEKPRKGDDPMNPTVRKAYRLLVLSLVLVCLLPCVCQVAAESDAPPASDSGLSTFERVLQGIGLTILFGGIALLPVYFVLNSRRQRIRRSFDQPKEDQDESNP